MPETRPTSGVGTWNHLVPPPNPTVRLRRSTTRPDSPARTWGPEARRLIDGGEGVWRVTGAAGHGVSSLLLDTALERLRQGADPDGLLIITPSKEAAARLRGQLAGHLREIPGFAGSAPLVRSAPSFAFALLRAAAVRSGEQSPRLITGAEQDAVIRELLAGHAEDGLGSWPAELRPALTMVGFARQLRDFLLRAVERGLGPEDLVRLGQEHARPAWRAAGDFLREYERTMALGGVRRYNASELVTVAIESLALDTGLLDRQRESLHTLLIDDAQNLDPRTAELLGLFIPSTRLTVIAGDPGQSVFRFRGADPDFLTDHPCTDELILDVPHRTPAHRGAVICDSAATQSGTVADTLRRAHLMDGVPWTRMAVIVRSTGALGAVRRALLAAGVPVQLDPTDTVLAEQRIVSAILLAARALDGPLERTEVEELVLGPVGGADPVTLRRLLRGLRQAELRRGGQRRAVDVLADLVLPHGSTAGTPPRDVGADGGDDGGGTGATDFLTDRETEILDRVRSVLTAGVGAHRAGGSVELVLWELWNATGLADRLSAASLRGGTAGSQADRDLDAMMALFDAAGDFVERRPTAGTASFVRHITEQQLPTGARDRRGVEPDAVHLLTAHAAGGREWHTVVIAGVQEGTWPTTSETGTLFGQEDLVDLLDDGIDPDIHISRSVERLAEERRLFHLACTRATDTLLVTALDTPEGNEVLEPSRFLGELGVEVRRITGGPGDTGGEVPGDTGAADGVPGGPRLLSVPAMVGELRRTVCDPGQLGSRRRQAARQLARLAEAGVPGADPDQWWGLAGPSTDRPVRPHRDTVTLSPSQIEQIAECPLRAVLGRVDTDEEIPLHLVAGILAHGFAEAVGEGADRDEAARMVRDAYTRVLDLTGTPNWRTPTDLAAWDRLIARTTDWITVSRSVFTAVGVEVPVSVTVGTTEDGRDLVITGRMDRLERTSDGSLVVVDLKTGTQPPTQKSMGEHAQLAAYQLALSRGTVIPDTTAGDVPGRVRVTDAGSPGSAESVGGGVLVYPGTTSAKITTRDQAAKTPEELDELAATLPRLAASVTGPRLAARVNRSCDRCPLRRMCPAHEEGRMLTDVR
ncbi:ATP-dependent DNA helicase [Corynebacterium pygosceleis]|uniref:ATP-dependent DNA helicase n=1 Tax=Corynebacterium pygosceleis TaxID=2800406 RepID=UPI0019067D6D|nr:ATP-dependent DNA helicase [Corynebacterium pygosceleis]MCK7674925.1 ATP-dependent helicase [Corynebacterium pygosceleis]MCL0119486.1 ATP-dependent helicase [Corynebacterium pygosceleis]